MGGQSVHERFVTALRARLNGQSGILSGGGNGGGDKDGTGDSVWTPARARGVGVDAGVIRAAAAEVVCGGGGGSKSLNEANSIDENSAPKSSLDSDASASIDIDRLCSDFVTRVPIGFARRFCMLGLRAADGSLDIVMADTTNLTAIQAVRRLLGRSARTVFGDKDAILAAINTAYSNTTAAGELEDITVLDREQLGTGAVEDLLDHEGRAPVVKLINMVLLEAVRLGCSDVHIQPFDDRLAVRFRVDGVLRDMYWPSPSLHSEIISRIKVMGSMDIAERRLAQDGRTSVEVGGRVVDLRISTLPTSFGERAVIRLLDKSLRLYRLPEIGMPGDVLTKFRRFIHMDHGIILVTGPTGSGKSTTLYAALGEINSRELNILTLEDPIEYRLEGISQTQVATRKGMTFASGLRHVLRQDPDIIMVGEIRDAETARMAIQSALTGHLVFSTLHTNDAAGAVARMLDLGVEPYLLAGSLLCSLAQRLVRKKCSACGGADPNCSVCLGTGVRGRLGIFELLSVNEDVRQLILERAGAAEIRAASKASGMRTLRCDGLDKAAAGLTTLEDVDRVAAAADGE